MPLSPGDLAPSFSMVADTGDIISSASLKGQLFVLYFYPKDDTSGCTAEACQFRDLLPNFSKIDVPVFGVSRDNTNSHRLFKEKYQLPFVLLSDEDGSVCQSYNVWVEKSMYGRKYFGIERSTFLIDSQGIIAAVWHKVKVPDHAQEVLKTLNDFIKQ
ncbi:MAG: thioredoxin-dependent thiol peroxidase [Alphaproteobacteria bacterium]